MKFALTDLAIKFINTLSEDDLNRAIITETTFESDDETLRDKLFVFLRKRAEEVGAEIRAFNKQLCIEHPEYFE